MIDKKISELTSSQTVSPSDLLAIVQNINGALQTRNITAANFLSSLGIGTERVLKITDSNAAQYFVDYDEMTWLSIPAGYRIVDVQTTQTYTTIAGIRPVAGDFPDYTRLTVMGNIGFREGQLRHGDYRTSVLLYTYRGGNHAIAYGMEEAYIEFMIKDKVWFTTLY